jgi:hypothetical protein
LEAEPAVAGTSGTPGVAERGVAELVVLEDTEVIPGGVVCMVDGELNASTKGSRSIGGEVCVQIMVDGVGPELVLPVFMFKRRESGWVMIPYPGNCGPPITVRLDGIS